MLKNNTTKRKFGRLSVIISAIVYILISLDFFENQSCLFGIGLGFVGIINLFLLKWLQSKSISVAVNGLNFIAAAFIAISDYLNAGRYLLWIGIAVAYLVVTVMFILKWKRKSNDSAVDVDAKL